MTQLLQWRKPDPTSLDSENAVAIARGYGGEYVIMDCSDGFTLWIAEDAFDHIDFETVDEAKEYAEREFRAAVRRFAVKLKDVDRWCPDRCPITFRPFFMWIEHPDGGEVPTYGGPFDSYTIPEPVIDDPVSCPRHEIEFRCERFDHDLGGWIEGGEDPCLRVIHEETLIEFEEPTEGGEG